jgi:hypothetical protein
MTDMPLTQILIIAPPGRKRENLVTMAGSVMKDISIQLAETCQQGLGLLLSSMPTLILVDYRNPAEEMQDEIENISQRYPHSQIVLLQNRLRQNKHFTDLPIQEVVYDDISCETLLRLLHENK